MISVDKYEISYLYITLHYRYNFYFYNCYYFYYYNYYYFYHYHYYYYYYYFYYFYYYYCGFISNQSDSILETILLPQIQYRRAYNLPSCICCLVT